MLLFASHCTWMRQILMHSSIHHTYRVENNLHEADATSFRDLWNIPDISVRWISYINTVKSIQ